MPVTAMTSAVIGTIASTAGSKIHQLAAQLHDTRRRGHEQQREDAGQKQPGLPHLIELEHAEFERRGQQQQAVHAGRDRQRQHRRQHLARQAERRDAGKLENILHTITLFFTKFVYHHTTRVNIRQVVHCMKTIHIFLSALWESALVFWG